MSDPSTQPGTASTGQSQFTVCLIEFLAFLGAPFLKQLQNIIAAEIDQLKVLEGELLAQEELGQSNSTAINQAIGEVTAVASEVQNTIAAMPLGVFQDCEAAANLVGVLRDTMDTVFQSLQDYENQGNRVRAMSEVQSLTSEIFDDNITYLQNLNSEIGVVLVELAKGQDLDGGIAPPPGLPASFTS